MKKVLLLCLLLISLPLAFASLADYPEMFLVSVNGENYLNAMIVIGDTAAASDTIGAVDIATSLNYDTNVNDPLKNSIEVVLASDVKGLEKRKNMILIGGPCINSATAAIMGYPENCAEGFHAGKAKIKLYENDGHFALIVAGMTGPDTRLAAKILADKLYDLSGDEVEVAGTNMRDVIIS